MHGEARWRQVSARLRQLEERGSLDPHAVVTEARDPASVLHGEFEWDDTTAAEQYRLAQARRLIRQVRLEVHEDTRVITSVAYVRDPDADTHDAGYAPVRELRTDRDRARRALLNELARASAYVARARNLAEMLGFEGAVDLVEKDLATLRAQVGSDAA